MRGKGSGQIAPVFYSSTATSCQSTLGLGPRCWPKCTGASLRKRRPLLWESDEPTVEERGRPNALSAAASARLGAEGTEEGAAEATDSTCAWVGYEAETVGARVRKLPRGRASSGDEDMSGFGGMRTVLLAMVGRMDDGRALVSARQKGVFGSGVVFFWEVFF